LGIRPKFNFSKNEDAPQKHFLIFEKCSKLEIFNFGGFGAQNQCLLLSNLPTGIWRFCGFYIKNQYLLFARIDIQNLCLLILSPRTVNDCYSNNHTVT